MSFSSGTGQMLLLRFLLPLLCAASSTHAAAVWKVTGNDGGTLYLGGSIHALRSTDYPLPPAFNHAFDASSRIVFEVDEKALTASSSNLVKEGQYPKGDSLKNHVDPRTYEYVRRVFGLMKVPEQQFAKYRPWFLVLLLQSQGMRDFSGRLGVDQFLLNRAKANKKPVLGLESTREHAQVFSGLTDRQGETLLLLTFIPQRKGGNSEDWMKDWRRGDADAIARGMYDTYRDFPSFARRLLDDRNHRWMPQIERFLKSGETHFVVVGAAHLGGPAGVLTMLRARGYQVTQL